MGWFSRVLTAFPPAALAALAFAPAQAQELPTFPSDVELVTVDAVVLDDDGEPVAGLTREDFELRDEGEPREILTFEALDTPVEPVPLTREERRVSTNVDAEPGRVVAVLWDEAHLSPLVAEDAKRALRPWLAERLDAGDRVVLAGTGGEWSVADGAAGRDALLGLVDELGWSRRGEDEPEHILDYEAFQIHFRDDSSTYGVVRRRFEAQGVPGCGQLFSGGGPGMAAPPDVSGPIPRNDPCPVLERAMETANAARNRIRATLQVLERLCEALAVARGRKPVVLVSQGFTRDRDFADELEAVNRIAQRANAVVTFLDPAGVRGPRGYGASSRGAPVAADQAGAGAIFLADQAGAERVALATGGSVVRTNDLPAGLEKVTRESQTYYLLGFAPAPGAEAGAFRRIDLKVGRPGLNVRARRGYTAGATADRDPDEQLRRVFDAPFDLPGHPLRVAAWVFEPRPPDLNRVMLGIDVAFPPGTRGPEGRPETVDLFVQVEGEGRRWRQDREIVFEPRAGPADAARGLWYLALLEFELPAGSYRARVAVREQDSSEFGAVAHAFEVPAVEAWRLSTPLLSGSLLVGPDGQTAVPVPTTRRDFEAAGTLHGQFAVYGSVREPGTGDVDLSGRWTLGRVDGSTAARSGSLGLVPGADGAVACRFGVPLEGLSDGEYELVLRVRDERAGRELEDIEPIELTTGTAGEARVSGLASVPEPPAASPRRPEPVDPELGRLLERAGQYVVDYEQRFSNIVAEETYTQQVFALDNMRDSGDQRRVTRADLVFVRLDNEVRWGTFRDVFEVDGQPVRDREARLEKLFLSSTTSGIERTREILEESAAYNIGPVIRTVNLPTLPLAFLHPQNQERFVFERKGRRVFEGVEGVEIRFEEVGRPTLVSREDSRALPAKGRFWIDPERGTVLRTETHFLFPPARATASISTQYRREPTLALWVPSEMREEYADIPGSTWPLFRRPSEAIARYSNYRRFGVTVEEEARVPEDDEP